MSNEQTSSFLVLNRQFSKEEERKPRAREACSPAARRKKKHIKIWKQQGTKAPHHRAPFPFHPPPAAPPLCLSRSAPPLPPSSSRLIAVDRVPFRLCSGRERGQLSRRRSESGTGAGRGGRGSPDLS
ncbi:hypothetical protein PVAP13_9NG698128 [Panicum virgatum]|uniref:Uncharacterized protein n=1 Tax=Panicum virgatum TaxID=38727 RepID=A0A8T0N052_PANVG|nr:hypothetical protein PVAP13_9NG698128 [Panicum virgatum]